MKNILFQLDFKCNQATQKIKNCICNSRGDFYISDGVKVIIAVVLGALLLAAMTAIFNDTVIPRITSVIEDLFS